MAYFDGAAEKFITFVRGDVCARGLSHWIDSTALRLTNCIDRCIGPKRPDGGYAAAPVDDEEGQDEKPRAASVERARLFRRKYCMPRRRLVRRADGALHWERLRPGEATARSCGYHECDFPLTSLTEFGEGWPLYFWTLKMVGSLSLLAALLTAAAWYDQDHRKHSDEELPVRDAAAAAAILRVR